MSDESTSRRKSIFRVGGLACRMLVIATAVLGMTGLISESMLFGIAYGYLAIFSLFSVVLVSLFCLGRRTAVVGGGIVAGSILYALIRYRDYLVEMRYVPQALWNGCLDRMQKAGYLTSIYPADYVSRLSDRTLICIGMVCILLLLAVLYTLCLLRRVDLVPPAAVSTAILVILTTLDLYDDRASALSMALPIVAFAAILVMTASDRILRTGQIFRSTAPEASAGYAAVAALLVFSLIITLPTMRIATVSSVPGSSDSTLARLKSYVTALLQGDDDTLDSLNYRWDRDSSRPRPADATAPTFTGQELLHIRAGADIPYYLTGWIGVDYRNGAWQPANGDTLSAYRSLFGMKQDPAEALRESFYAYTLADRIADPQGGAIDACEYGFVTTQVDLNWLTSPGPVCYLPTVYAPRYGLQAQDGATTTVSYVNYFDGIRTGRSFDQRNTSYSVTAYAPVMTDPQWIERIADLYAAWSRSAETSELTRVYGDFVYDTYTSGTDSSVIQELATTICLTMPEVSLAAVRDPESREGPLQRDRLTRAVIDYVIDELGCRYTLTPDPDRTSSALDGVENFLSVTQEGYCVQFASATVLLLRACGIPARYVEGYIVTELEEDPSGGYTGSVHDYQAHAWAEVYFDGIGWIPYETTPAYYEVIYASKGASAPGPDVPPETETRPARPPVTEPGTGNDTETAPLPSIPATDPVIEPVTGPDTDTISQEEDTTPPPVEPETDPPTQGSSRSFYWSVLPGCLLFLAAVWLYIRYARRSGTRYVRLAEHMLAEDAPPARQDIQALCEAVRRLMVYYRAAPQTGELPEDYAVRAAIFLTRPDLSEEHRRLPDELPALVDAMSAEEFGNGMTHEEAKQLCRFYLFLWGERKHRLTIWQRLRLRLIFHEL